MKKLIVIFILVFSSIGFSDNITDKLDEAFYYKEAGFLLKAKSIYEEYSPVSQEAKLKLAEFYLEDLQIETGEKLLKELAAQNNQEAKKILAIRYLSNGENDKAEKLFDKKSTKDMFSLAEAYLSNGTVYEYNNMGESDKNVEKGREIYKDLYRKGNKEAFYKLLSTYSSSSIIEITDFEMYKGNKDNELNKITGDAYFSNGNYTNAVKYYKIYLKNAKGNWNIFNAFTYAYTGEELAKELQPYIKRGDEGAAEALTQALSRSDEEGYFGMPNDIYVQLAEAKTLEEKEKIYLKLVEEEKGSTKKEGIIGLLSLYQRYNETDKYNKYLKKVLDEGFYLDTYWTILKSDDAVEIYKNYIKQGINRANGELGSIYVSRKEYGNAVQIFEEMKRNGSDTVNNDIHLADLYNKAGKYNEAIEAAGKNSKNEDKTLVFMKLYAEYKLGNYDTAKKYIDELKDAYYDYDSSFYYPKEIYLLDIYEKTGMTKEYKELEADLKEKAKEDYGFFGMTDTTGSKALADYYASKGKFSEANQLLISHSEKNPFTMMISLGMNFYGMMPKLDTSGNSKVAADIVLKYKDYKEIKAFTNEAILLAENSRENSKEYLQAMKTMGFYILKQEAGNTGDGENLGKILNKYSNESLKSSFKNSYKNLYKNKKGISFYPDAESNIFLSSLMSEWNIKKMAPVTQSPTHDYIKGLIFSNVFSYFFMKYDLSLEEFGAAFAGENGGNSYVYLEEVVDRFDGQMHFDKDFEEFYNLLPTIILIDFQDKLVLHGRTDIKEQLDKDYAKYLQPEKLKKAKEIMEKSSSFGSGNVFGVF